MLVSSQMSSDHVLGRVLTDGNVLEDLEMPSYFPAWSLLVSVVLVVHGCPAMVRWTTFILTV